MIRFVAWMRLQDGNDFDATSPSLAEALLLKALRDTPVHDRPDDDATAYAQVALLRALTIDLSEQHVDAVFDYARQQADRWLQQAGDDASNC